MRACKSHIIQWRARASGSARSDNPVSLHQQHGDKSPSTAACSGGTTVTYLHNQRCLFDVSIGASVWNFRNMASEAGVRERLLDEGTSKSFGSVSSAASSSRKGEGESMMANRAERYQIWVQPLIAEFWGQLIFAFLHCSTAYTNMNIAYGSPLLPAINDGFTVAIMVILIGHISGAHVNFAVTFAVFVGGGIKWFMVPLYLIAQLLGSLAGAGLAFVANGASSGAFALVGETTVGQGVLVECILTILLTMAVLLAAVELSSNNAAFAIGFAILIDILASFQTTGGCMNPSLSFGPAVVAGMWTNYWVYWVAPLLGALISGVVFRLFLGGKARLLFRQEVSDDSRAEGIEKGDSGRR